MIHNSTQNRKSIFTKTIVECNIPVFRNFVFVFLDCFEIDWELVLLLKIYQSKNYIQFAITLYILLLKLCNTSFAPLKIKNVIVNYNLLILFILNYISTK